MKQCPTCRAFYDDDNDFCLNDGSVLANTSPARMPETGGSGPAAWLYLVMGAMGAVIVIGAIYIFTSGTGTPTNGQLVSGGGSPERQSPAGTPTASPNPSRSVESTPTPPPAASPKGHWSGDWSSPSGAYLTIVVDLDDDGSGGITGRIEWTLVRTRRPDKMSKIGMSATEYVSGRFDPATRTLSVKGQRKNDPNNMLVMLDSYRLVLSGDERSLEGRAQNGGKWDGRVKLSR